MARSCRRLSGGNRKRRSKSCHRRRRRSRSHSRSPFRYCNKSVLGQGFGGSQLQYCPYGDKSMGFPGFGGIDGISGLGFGGIDGIGGLGLGYGGKMPRGYRKYLMMQALFNAQKKKGPGYTPPGLERSEDQPFKL